MSDPEQPSRPLPAVRASDADRERVANVLRRAGGSGQLTVEELDERVAAAYAAQTHADLDRLTEDLGPVAGQAQTGLSVRPGDDGSRLIVSIMGGSDRRGRWRVGRRCTVLNLMGGGNLDLNDAELADDVVELRVWSLMGGSDVWVPEGLNVEVSEFALMGGNDLHIGPAQPASDRPLIKIRLISVMGGTTVRRGRRLSRRERKLERERRRKLER
jgi:hypothetical protein